MADARRLRLLERCRVLHAELTAGKSVESVKEELAGVANLIGAEYRVVQMAVRVWIDELGKGSSGDATGRLGNSTSSFVDFLLAHVD